MSTTTATVNSQLVPSYISADFQENRSIQQRYDGSIFVPGTFLPTAIYPPISDLCDFSYRKPIISKTPTFVIVTPNDPCEEGYWAKANGLSVPTGSVTYNWTATVLETGQSLTGTSQTFDFNTIIPVDIDPTVTVALTLNIHTSCGDDNNHSLAVTYFPCVDGDGHHERQIKINPNPTLGQISIRVMQNNTEDFITTDPNGIRIRIYPSGGVNTVMDNYLYTPGQTFNLGTLPNGVYQVRANASDLTPLTANLTIIH